MNKCEVIAVSNQKGGVAKTTTCRNLGHGLACQGKKVLLIDNDPQGSLTDACGWEPYNLESTIADVYESIMREESSDLEKIIQYHEEGFDLIPANIDLAGTEMALNITMNREYILKEAVAALRRQYDYILIDCSPSLGIFSLNALAAADSVIIPVQTNYMPAKGLQLLLQTIAKTRKKLNPDLHIKGILFTLVDGRTNDAKKIAKTIQDTYGDDIPIFQTKIPMSVKLAESPEFGESIFVRSKGKNYIGAAAYEQLTQEIITGGR